MRKRDSSWAWAALALGLFSAVPGRAADKEPDKDRPRSEAKEERRGEGLAKKLGLAPEQADKLKEHRKAHREKAKVLREDVKERFKALREELEKPVLDEGKVRAAHKELKAARERLADHRLDGILAVRKLLTPEQYAKLKDMRHHRRGGFFRRWGRGGRDGDHDGDSDRNL